MQSFRSTFNKVDLIVAVYGEIVVVTKIRAYETDAHRSRSNCAQELFIVFGRGPKESFYGSARVELPPWKP